MFSDLKAAVLVYRGFLGIHSPYMTILVFIVAANLPTHELNNLSILINIEQSMYIYIYNYYAYMVTPVYLGI